jgi:hypothetical protein
LDTYSVLSLAVLGTGPEIEAASTEELEIGVSKSNRRRADGPKDDSVVTAFMKIFSPTPENLERNS